MGEIYTLHGFNYPVRLFWIISSFCGRDACTNMLSITFTSNEVDTEGTIQYNSSLNVGAIPGYSACMRVLTFHPLLSFPFLSVFMSFRLHDPGRILFIYHIHFSFINLT